MTNEVRQLNQLPKRPRHTHRFWIPVAWKDKAELTQYGWMYLGMEAVTLRCDCGKEIRREGEA